MKKVFALVALAGIASVAVAAPKLQFQVSTDGGATWGSSANAAAGSAVQVRMVVDWTGSTAYGFSGTLAKIVYTSVDGGDVLPSSGANTLRSAPWAFGAAGTLGSSLSGTTRTVGSASGTNVGFISFGQQAPASASAYSTANPAIIGAWTITVGAGRSLGSILGLSGLASAANGAGTGVPAGAFAFHATNGSSNTSFREDGSVEGATITIVPTPGALALLGLGGLVTGRRRR